MGTTSVRFTRDRTITAGHELPFGEVRCGLPHW